MPELAVPLITACILARNEESRLEDALRSLLGWTDEILVIDNESEDRTVEVARRYTDRILRAPHCANFDAARNLAIEHARGEWIFYLDADERVPPRLGETIRRMVTERGGEFEALYLPFRHYFCGRWMRNGLWWPGYTRPQLLKKGSFSYNARLHAGVEVQGRTLLFPADDPELSILHYSYEDLHHYFHKLNNYTDGEAESLLADGANHSWQALLAHFVHDWCTYYDRAAAHQDEMEGFILSFLSGFYRWVSRAKLWDLRRRREGLDRAEPLPASVGEMLEFMLHVSATGAEPWLQPRHKGAAGPRSVPAEWLATAATGNAEPIAPPAENLGITACVIARNEAARIVPALRSLRGWVDQIILVDNASTDDTATLAAPYADLILPAPPAGSLEEVRVQMAEAIHAAAFATGDWLFYLDADERVSASLGQAVRQLVRERGAEFDALCLPFKNQFYGRWMQSGVWWPAYKGPQLLRKDTFSYSSRIHSGPQSTGRLLYLPADDPDRVIEHLAYDSIRDYVRKLNAYTDREAEALREERFPHAWQTALAMFVRDWQIHYDEGHAYQDGMQGFLQSFLCAYYRFVSCAKLWDLRRRSGELRGQEAVPPSVREMLEFMRRVYQEGTEPWLQTRVPESPNRVPLLWKGPLFDASGYADEGRNLVLSLVEAGETVAITPDTWSEVEVSLAPEDEAHLRQRIVPQETLAAIAVSHTLMGLQQPLPTAQFCVARTMFETDRIHPQWAERLNRMDRIWVPSAFNRETFIRSGVAAEKIAVVPGAFDAEPFLQEQEPWPLPLSAADSDITDTPAPFVFLSVFDWTLHKGWDMLLEAFAREFAPSAASRRAAKGNRDSSEPPPVLVIKTWSSNGYSFADIQAQADAFLRERLGTSLTDYPNIVLLQEHLSTTDFPRLYRSANAFVLPTRGEGWCRPLMEAMASGLPTIATGWSGLTEFHDAEVGYPLQFQVVPVSEAGAAEIPVYRGHQWAEPDLGHLRRLLRNLSRRPAAAERRARAGQERVSHRYSRAAVAPRLIEELAVCRRQLEQKLASEIAAAGRAATSRPAGTRPLESAVLLQAAAGEHIRMLEVARERHASYAQAHGFEYVIRCDRPAGERSPHWDKIALILAALREGRHEFIAWLDADTLIADDAADLRQALTPGAWLGMVRQGTPAWLNSGAIYIRSCPEALAFFQEVWDEWPVDHFWEDNQAILKVLSRQPERWTGVTALDDIWNSTRLMNECERPVVMAWHGNGSVRDRVQMMRHAIPHLARRKNHEPLPEIVWTPVDQRPAPFRPAANPVPIDELPTVDFRALLGRPLRVRWEGDQAVLSSLARVNREFCWGLLACGDVELSVGMDHPGTADKLEKLDVRLPALLARCQAGLSGPPDVTIRHHWPPNWQRPEHGKLVVIQPWEGSHLPRLEWLDGATNGANQVWAYSRFVRDVYGRSGVAAEKVRVVPLGISTEEFTPLGPVYPLRTSKTMRFLFVGGTLERKGADLLLEAYLTSFTPEDDVCLVVKEMGARTFYRGQTLGAAFQQVQGDHRTPEVIYLEDELSDVDLAALYRACDCVVLPYRGEGFALVPLEGMACGAMPIVTAGGATEDYLDDSMALRVPARRRLLPNQYPNDPGEYAGIRWDTEPDLDALMAALRWAYEHREETRERGRLGAAYAQAGWTWDRAVATARVALWELLEPAAVEHRREPVTPARTRRSAKQRPRQRKELSLCMIVRDEEPRLRECLESIAPYVDEMVVVDTGSTDRTREIAHECGARVHDFPWCDDFAAARNHSMELATGEWVFWMDADDIIPASCGERLRELVKSRPEQDAAFLMEVRIPPGPGEFSPSAVDHVKLFPNREDLRFAHRIHEQVLPAVRRAGLDVVPTELYVTHRNYDRSPEGQTKKRLRDFRLLEMDLRDQPDHPFVLFNLGMTYLYATRDFEIAAHYLERSLRRSEPQDSIVRKAYAMLTTARVSANAWEAALKANEAGRAVYPDDPELLFQAGQLYQQCGRFADARLALERLVASSERPHFRSVDVGLSSYRGLHELALLFRRMGDARHCAQLLQQIIAEHPTYQPARVDLAETLSRLGGNEGIGGMDPHGSQARTVAQPQGAARPQLAGRGVIGKADTARAADPSGSLRTLLRDLGTFPSEKPVVSPHDHGWLAEGTAVALRAHLGEDTRLVVELGSWLGRSTRFIADCAPNATVIAIDHWEGSAEQQADVECSRLLPMLYETFLVNCWEYRQRVQPLKMNTCAGLDAVARTLASAGLCPDLIYVDAAHDYTSVRADVQTVLRLFPAARVVGDDWNHPGVRGAVMDLVCELGLDERLRCNSSAWWLE